MSAQTPPSPKTPQRKHLPWQNATSPSCMDSSSPGCCSTPSTSKKEKEKRPVSSPKVLWDKNSPTKRTTLLGSPISKHSFSSPDCRSRRHSQSLSKDSESDASGSFSKHASSTDPSWNVKTFSSTESNGTVTVELDFPQGGWDEEESSDEISTCSLEIVESEVECKSSPLRHGRKRKQSEVSEEDNAILSGMGEEIERQLEAKAERNRLTVPNVKNILRTVITNPYVQEMVRRSIKSGDVAVSGDISFEPRMTRAKARLLCDSNDSNTPVVSWSKTPHKSQPPSECQALINEELNDDSEDDEEYQPGEDEPSDNEYGSEKGSERDISLEQSPACGDTDTDSCPATPSPSPRLLITDSATQTNWSEDGVFKVPLAPTEPQLDLNKEENIALRTRSKLPLNDTPLEEIEQAFIPPDITPDLYDTTCDNADWQEFLNEFMQPMRSEPESQNHDDEEEDPEYNVLAEEEIIDREELRMDRAVKISKRELNELMRELMEFTENMSSDDEDKIANKEKGTNASSNVGSPSALACNEDMSLFLDAYMSYGTLAPMTGTKATPPPSRSPSTPSLHTPVPPISPPCIRTPGTAKKALPTGSNSVDMNYGSEESCYFSGSKGKSFNPSSGKKHTPGKLDNFQNTTGATQSGKKQTFHTPGKSGSCSSMSNGSESGKKQHMPQIPGKPESYPSSAVRDPSGKKQRSPYTPGKPDSYPNAACGSGKKQNVANKSDNSNVGGEGANFSRPNRGKLDSYQATCEGFDDSNLLCASDMDTIGLIGANNPIPVSDYNKKQQFTPAKEYFMLNSTTDWENTDRNTVNADHPSVLSNAENWYGCNNQEERSESLSAFPEDTAPVNETADDDFTSDAELSVSLQVSSSPPTPEGTEKDLFTSKSNVHLSSKGDVILDNTILLSAAQRLVLDQQMRQYIQLTTQHFLQTYQHPDLSKYSEICKKQLVSIHSKANKKENSAFNAANLLPCLEVISKWEEMLSSEEGPEILRFVETQVSEAKRQMRRRHIFVEKFSPQLMSLMANSKAFVYPQLLPHMPFRSTLRQVIMLPSEEHLLVVGLEEFTQFIQENNPEVKRCLRWAINLVTEYLLVGRNPDNVYNYIRKMSKRSRTIKHYFENKCAPPTSHIVIPFKQQNVIPLKHQPHNLLPALWRDFLYPAIH